MGSRSYGNCSVKWISKGDLRRLPTQQVPQIASLLHLIDSSASPEQLRAYGYRIRCLLGYRKGFSAVLISKDLRVVFRFVNGNAYDVEVVDDHWS